MSGLRERVTDEVASALLGSGIGHDPDDAAHVADAALSVFAEWLRERANEHHTRGNWDSERHIDELADEMAPKP